MTRARTLAALLSVAACGDNAAPTGAFEIVGHHDLGARGMNAALAVAGDFAYVGSRIDGKPVLIVEISDPTRPTVVGELGPPDEGVAGMSSRELRAVADLNLLVILNLQCSPQLHGCAPGAAEAENLKLFDISDRRVPRLLATHRVTGMGLARPSPHEMFLWRDPHDPARVLVLLAQPGVPSLEVLDISSGAFVSVLRWDPYADGGVPRGGQDNLLHSVATSDDGRTGYLSHQTAGLFVADLGAIVDRADPPRITMTTPADRALSFGAMGPHSAVPVPGRSLLLVTEEVYPPPFGAGCPWGHVRTVDISDPARPVLVGEYRLPENDPGCAAAAPQTAYTAHNATTTANLALVTWYAGGLQAIDIADPAAPAFLAELRPDPLETVAVEDPGLGGSKIEMWSYPVIHDGLIYVVDSRNGLYVLRYRGRWGEQISAERFLEGNSNL